MKKWTVHRTAERTIEEIQSATVSAENEEDAIEAARKLEDWDWTNEQTLDEFVNHARDYEAEEAISGGEKS